MPLHLKQFDTRRSGHSIKRRALLVIVEAVKRHKLQLRMLLILMGLKHSDRSE